MLAFIPWLRLREPVRVGRLGLVPHSPDAAFDVEVDTEAALATLNQLLSQYRTQPSLVVRSLCVFQYDGRPLGGDLDEAERAEVFRFGRHLAVAGLSRRRFLGDFPDRYTASGHYQPIIQGFSTTFSGNVLLEHRRKGGCSRVLMGQSDVHFVLPAHLVTQGEPELDLPMLSALELGLPQLPDATREHVHASIVQFLLSNSDAPDVPPEVEAVATYAAFEQLANDDNLGKVRSRVLELLHLADSTPAAARLRRERLESDVARPVTAKWLNHLYRMRGCLAHGKSADGCASDWSQNEHLVAGAFVYPLVLKCFLYESHLYELTVEDVAKILGLEALLEDRPFFEQVEDAEAAADTSLQVEPQPLARWQRQFKRINYALFGVELSGTIQVAYDEVTARAAEADNQA